MSVSVPTTLYEVYGEELAELLDTVLAGEVVSDRAAAERLVRSVGALLRLHQRHRLDEHGRCALCWSVPRHWFRPWPKRSTCTVHTTLGLFLRQPANFALSTLTDRPQPGVRGVS